MMEKRVQMTENTYGDLLLEVELLGLRVWFTPT